MLAAYDAGMVGGDFVFIYTNQIIPSEDNMADFASTSFYAGSDGRQDAARVAYQNLIMVGEKDSFLWFLKSTDTIFRLCYLKNVNGYPPIWP